MTEAGQFAMWLAIGGTTIATIVVLEPLVKALARRLEGGATSADLLDRVEALERQGMVSGEVDLTRQRLAELEERLDFAERLLGRSRTAERALPPAE